MVSSALRLFSGDDDPQPQETVSYLWSMSGGLREHLVKGKRAKATLDEYETHLASFQQFWVSGGTPRWLHPQQAADAQSAACSPLWQPPFFDLTAADLRAFRSYVELVEGYGERTQNKRVGGIQTILKFAVELGRLGVAPAIRPLAANEVAQKVYLTPAEVCRLYEACGVATWPRFDRHKHRLPRGPAGQWRAALVWYLNYGFRTQELYAYEPDHAGIKWRQIREIIDRPPPGGKLICPHGYFHYVPQKQKRRKKQPLILPLNEITAAHLASIRPADCNLDEPVFAWPRSASAFYPQWKRILLAAGVRPELLDDTESAYQINHLRKTCATWHDDNIPNSGSLVLGHAPRDVTHKHYVNGEATVLKAVLTLPQPRAFRQIFETLESPADPQRRLF